MHKRCLQVVEPQQILSPAKHIKDLTLCRHMSHCVSQNSRKSLMRMFK